MAPLTTVTTLVGAGNGSWSGATGPGNGTVELVLARVPGRDTVLGQFTFVTGGTSRTLRYEGRLQDGRLQFPLVGEGRIVLEPKETVRPSSAATLQGEWVDARGALPAPSGTLRLTRLPI